MSNGFAETNGAPAYAAAQADLRHQVEVYASLINNVADYLHTMTEDGTITYANRALQGIAGAAQPLVGRSLRDLLSGDSAQIADNIIKAVRRDGAWQGKTRYNRAGNEPVAVQLTVFPLATGNGGAPGGGHALFGAIARDLSAQLRAEKEQLALQEQIIAIQQSVLHELSTPLMPLARGVIAMPLIGAIDSGRAQQIIEELLAGVVNHRATIALIDITGVGVVDTQVANALVRAAQSVKLLGAQVILTGIRPEVAQTMVGLGINLNTLITLNSLQDGIAYALQRS